MTRKWFWKTTYFSSTWNTDYLCVYELRIDGTFDACKCKFKSGEQRVWFRYFALTSGIIINFIVTLEGVTFAKF